ncbi:hypothetical protein SAMN05216532_0782 [Streptomyces sp. 2231.1]|uniref:hypothetical protein n=1 Tax=Streptomyces sp. 2231.1 TaxID=1855347 RepID=UPI000898E494|nr:hypothetical protein [Streptomyces sp. 2231.1]SEC21157.1 hypothetical protein SAMN05216532_0782 [Streptomyces sp. 2231.1]
MTTQQRPPESHAPPAGSRPRPAAGIVEAADIAARETTRDCGTGGALAAEAEHSAAAPHTLDVRPASSHSSPGMPHVR